MFLASTSVFCLFAEDFSDGNEVISVIQSDNLHYFTKNGVVEPSLQAITIAGKENTAFVMSLNYLHIVDTSSSAKYLGFLNIEGLKDIAVYNNSLFVAAGNEIALYNIQNSQSPVLEKELTLNGTINDLQIVDSNLYLATDKGLSILFMDEFSILKNLDIGWTSKLQFESGKLYAGGANGVAEIDVADSLTPYISNSSVGSADVEDMIVKNSVVYTNNFNGIEIYKNSDNFTDTISSPCNNAKFASNSTEVFVGCNSENFVVEKSFNALEILPEKDLGEIADEYKYNDLSFATIVFVDLSNDCNGFGPTCPANSVCKLIMVGYGLCECNKGYSEHWKGAQNKYYTNFECILDDPCKNNICPSYSSCSADSSNNPTCSCPAGMRFNYSSNKCDYNDRDGDSAIYCSKTQYYDEYLDCHIISANKEIIDLSKISYNSSELAKDNVGYIRIYGNRTTVEICTEANFKGKCAVVKGSVDVHHNATGYNIEQNEYKNILYGKAGSIRIRKHGVGYCGGSSYTCRYSTETINDFVNEKWDKTEKGESAYIKNSIQVLNVAPGWEAIACPAINNNSANGVNCIVYPGGDSGHEYDLTYQKFGGKVKLLTIQPANFDTAKIFYGFNGYWNYWDTAVSGFAYLYSSPEYGTNKKLFIKYGDKIDLQNTIIKPETVKSIRLYGNVTMNLTNLKNETKRLKTSTRDLSWGIYAPFDSKKQNPLYPYTDMRKFYNSVKSVSLESSPSVGWFLSDDNSQVSNKRYACYQVGNSTDAIRAECHQHNSDQFAFSEKVSSDEFYGRTTVFNGDINRFREYGDNYDLLVLSAHGYFGYYQDDNTKPYTALSIVNSGYTNRLRIGAENDTWSEPIGKNNTNWVVTTACNSMGKNGFDFGTDVIGAWKKSLETLNGVGGMRNKSYWWEYSDPHKYYKFRDNLHKPISEAWIDSFSEGGKGDPERDARFLTREKCDCNDKSCSDLYMLSDKFYTPMDSKVDLSNYHYYCLRDNGNWDVYSYYKTKKAVVLTLPVFNFQSTVKVYKSVVPTINQANAFIKQIDPALLNENVTIDGLNTIISMKRNFEPVDDFVVINEDVLNNLELSAANTAKKFTSLPLKLLRIKRDATTSFADNDYGIDELSTKTNRISFVYTPAVNDIPLLENYIEISYDGGGLYKISSNVPYNISSPSTKNLKTKAVTAAEIAKTLNIPAPTLDPANAGYIIDETGQLKLIYKYVDETNLKQINILMEK